MIALIDGDLVEQCGAVWLDAAGYVRRRKDQSVHRWVASLALGRDLQFHEHVHHINGNKLDNRRKNLLVCSSSYHTLLHARQDVFDAGFNPDTHHYCSCCKTYLEKSLFPKNRNAWNGVHNMCKMCSNTARRGKGYGKFNWRERMHQQVRRAVRKGLASSLVKEGRCL